MKHTHSLVLEEQRERARAREYNCSNNLTLHSMYVQCDKNMEYSKKIKITKVSIYTIGVSVDYIELTTRFFVLTRVYYIVFHYTLIEIRYILL